MPIELTPSFVFIIIELVCIALGAGSSFIFDSFFMTSHRHHKLKNYEVKLLRRLSLFSVISAVIALFSYLIYLGLQLETASDVRIGFLLAKIVMMALALLTGLSLRRLHLRTLLRHQNNYGHLSDSMVAHSDSLVATAAYSTVSWMAVIVLTAIEYRQAQDAFHFGFLHIIIAYIIVGYCASKAAIFLKRNLV